MARHNKRELDLTLLPQWLWHMPNGSVTDSEIAGEMPVFGSEKTKYRKCIMPFVCFTGVLLRDDKGVARTFCSDDFEMTF